MFSYDHRSNVIQVIGRFYYTNALISQILRSMLYRGSEVMREVAWVVFDEIHYMRDAGMWDPPIAFLSAS